MKIRSKAIWVVAVGVIIFAFVEQQLGFFDIFVICFIASILDKNFGDQNEKSTPAIESENPVFIPPAGKHLITTDGAKQIRNLLLKHHNMKQTEKDYIDSAMAKDTTAVVAMLNVFLKGK